MTMRTPYDRFPTIPATCTPDDCVRGWDAVCDRLRRAVAHRAGDRATVIAVECYPGVYDHELEGQLRARLRADHFVLSREAFKTAEEVQAVVEAYLGGDDPLFGVYADLNVADFLDDAALRAVRERVLAASGLVVVYGTGAVLCCEPDLLVYADMPRWEGQLRQRRGEVSNLGVSNAGERASLQYKRSFFIDWRAADRLKQQTIERWDFVLDTTAAGDPKLLAGPALRAALDGVSRRPFRVVPFFDPAPWGGQWLKETFALDSTAANYGWGFDCVPEENSLLLDCGEGVTVEIPSLDLIFYRPRQVLGLDVFRQFGAEFPIRFDFLDTMAGGNLSLQVHPTVAYARERFGLAYTQEESYYMLDAGDDARVFLGLKDGVDAAAMLTALRAAQAGGAPFAADRFIAHWPARKHDHFSIPAGTVHCSGANAVVLEISATPYIFTFKLWDWGRLGLDGLPRPINIDRGGDVIDWTRDQRWTRAHLLGQIERVAEGQGWVEERTGLHPTEFIETRRHWFTSTVPHDTAGTVNVLNLVEGNEATVRSPTDAFRPFVVHYAETFVVPAATGPYTVSPSGPSAGQRCGTVKAFVRYRV